MKSFDIIKYTIMPFKENEDYEKNFDLSISEFAKVLNEKQLLAPLLIYNQNLGVPIDNPYEDFTIYCKKEDIPSVIRKYEMVDPIRTLIIHGFEIDFDDLRDIFVPIARRNSANLCINTIMDIEMDSNITVYLEPDLDQEDDEEWEEIKKGMYKEIDKCIEEYHENYDNYEDYGKYKDYYDLDMIPESLLYAFMGISDDAKKYNKKAKCSLEENKSQLNDIEESDIDEDIVEFTYRYKNSLISFSSISDELFIIGDDEVEMVLTEDQINFLIDSYNKTKKIFKNEPCK